MDIEPSDFITGLLMLVFGIVGLFLASGAMDDEMYVFGLTLFGFAMAFEFGLLRPARCSPRRSMSCSAPAGRGCSAARRLANFVFWGYQFFIVMAALSYVMGFSQSQEYAEPEWHIDLWLTIVWVCYAVMFIGTLMKREEPHIYVANWFYLAFILTIAVLHIGNNI